MTSVMAGARPMRPHGSSPAWMKWGLTEDIWELMEKCWKERPMERPDAAAVVKRLTSDTNHHEDNVGSTLKAENNFQAEFRRQMSGPLQREMVRSLQDILAREIIRGPIKLQ
ncbi:hypothetical protein C0991_007016 [Blastosporella zonata]|nr:hypothetical protein C0991_007016 [Blastosporella zonata]